MKAMIFPAAVITFFFMLIVIGNVPEKSQIIDGLDSSDVKQQQDALQYVALIRHQDFTIPVASLLQSENEDVRDEALDALSELKNPKAIPFLKKAFENDKINEKDFLSTIGRIENPEALKLLKSFAGDGRELPGSASRRLETLENLYQRWNFHPDLDILNDAHWHVIKAGSDLE